MRIIGLTILLFSSNIFAQDNYHLLTQQMISDTYGLENGEWMMFDTETENLDIDYNYGALDILSLTTATQEFTQVTNILNEIEGGYFFDSGWGISNQVTITENDVCLLVINLRKTNNVNSFGKVTLGIQANDNSIFEESITIQLEDQWNQYLIPFQASATYLPDELIISLGLAWEIQEIELAGVNILNFGNNYLLNEMPLVLHNEKYGGYEANAPWRVDAENRIEQNRKADLEVLVLDAGNIPVEGASVEINMIEHDFAWGTEINLSRFADNNNQTQEYENKLLNLDGEGHTFNWVTPGNSFKWPGIEEGWIVPFNQKVNAVNWLKDNNYNIRFHTLLWPGWVNLPYDLEMNANDPQYIIDRTNEWVDFILTHPELQNVFDEYDVLNETTTNRDYEMSLAGFGTYTTGREYYLEILNQFRTLVPDKPQVINDYVTISNQQYKGTDYEFLKNTISEIIDGGADLNGIGFQAHQGLFPTSIYEVESILNDFENEFGLPLKITEYDFLDPRIDPEIAASYLDDFLTMIFSIQNVDMFMFWGIWDGTHQFGSGNLFDLDWNNKPAADVTFNKLFNEWWTEESAITNNLGSAEFRGFKGLYEIRINIDNESIIDTVSLINDTQLSYNIDLNTSIHGDFSKTLVNIFPNPNSIGILNIESNQELSDVELYNLKGELLLNKKANNNSRQQIQIENLPDGLYIMRIEINGNYYTQKIEIINK